MTRSPDRSGDPPGGGWYPQGGSSSPQALAAAPSGELSVAAFAFNTATASTQTSATLSTSSAGSGASGYMGGGAATGGERMGAAGSGSTRIPPKRVIYRSTNLTRTAPSLGAGTRDSERIREAHRIAEEVREQFRLEKAGEADLPTVTGIGESADAQRHKRRVKMNRDSAAISRVRREAYVSALELQLITLEKEFKRAQTELGVFQSSSAMGSQDSTLRPQRLTVSDIAQHASLEYAMQQAGSTQGQAQTPPAQMPADTPADMNPYLSPPSPPLASGTAFSFPVGAFGTPAYAASSPSHTLGPAPDPFFPFTPYPALSMTLMQHAQSSVAPVPSSQPPLASNGVGGLESNSEVASRAASYSGPAQNCRTPQTCSNMLEKRLSPQQPSSHSGSAAGFGLRQSNTPTAAQDQSVNAAPLSLDSTSNFTFPELVPQLAQIEPDFFSKLMTDYSRQELPQEPQIALDELLLLYRGVSD